MPCPGFYFKCFIGRDKNTEGDSDANKTKRLQPVLPEALLEGGPGLRAGERERDLSRSQIPKAAMNAQRLLRESNQSSRTCCWNGSASASGSGENGSGTETGSEGNESGSGKESGGAEEGCASGGAPANANGNGNATGIVRDCGGAEEGCESAADKYCGKRSEEREREIERDGIEMCTRIRGRGAEEIDEEEVRGRASAATLCSQVRQRRYDVQTNYQGVFRSAMLDS